MTSFSKFKPEKLSDCAGMIEDGTGVMARLSLVSAYLDGVATEMEDNEMYSMAAFTASNIVCQCIEELNAIALYMRGVEVTPAGVREVVRSIPGVA